MKTPRNEKEREAVSLAAEEARLGKLSVWSSAYDRAHAAWMVRRQNFQDRFGLDDTEVYNAIPEAAKGAK